jgi:hypothetical protein
VTVTSPPPDDESELALVHEAVAPIQPDSEYRTRVQKLQRRLSTLIMAVSDHLPPEEQLSPPLAPPPAPLDPAETEADRVERGRKLAWVTPQKGISLAGSSTPLRVRPAPSALPASPKALTREEELQEALGQIPHHRRSEAIPKEVVDKAREPFSHPLLVVRRATLDDVAPKPRGFPSEPVYPRIYEGGSPPRLPESGGAQANRPVSPVRRLASGSSFEPVRTPSSLRPGEEKLGPTVKALDQYGKPIWVELTQPTVVESDDQDGPRWRTADRDHDIEGHC